MAETWDYTTLAAHYDSRADYSAEAIDRVVAAMSLSAEDPVADLGAGTGKLAGPLARRGLAVYAVEPNDVMRTRGMANTRGLSVTWRDGSAERTGLGNMSMRAVTFGSSFNVVDQRSALREARRIVQPDGWFCCLWNHRNLDDPLQARIEQLIRQRIPDYDYGSRREDPTPVLTLSKLFGDVQSTAVDFEVRMTRQEAIEAWKSHATLARQAGPAFATLITAISELFTTEVVRVPYTTRAWYARFRE